MKNKFILIKTTYPDSTKGRRMAKSLVKILLDEKLAACIQFSSVETAYVWQEKIRNEREILVSIKSKNSLYKKIEKTIKEHHIYEIPQIFSTQINRGFTPYLNWIDSSIRNQK